MRDEAGRQVASQRAAARYGGRRPATLLGQPPGLTRQLHRAVCRNGSCGPRGLGGPSRGRLQGAARTAVRVRSLAGARARPRLVRQPSVVLGGVRQNDRLALQLDLAGEAGLLDGADVVFEIASTADGPALVQSSAALSTSPERGTALAEAIADVRLLPPGAYVARARVSVGRRGSRQMRRTFEISGPHRDSWLARRRRPAEPRHARSQCAWRHGRLSSCRRLQSTRCWSRACSARFSIGWPRDRTRHRRPSSISSSRRVRRGARDLPVPETVRPEAPAATAFLRGLSLLADQKLDPRGKPVPRRTARLTRLLPRHGVPRRVLRGGREGPRSRRRRGAPRSFGWTTWSPCT